MCFLWIQMVYLSYIHLARPHSEAIYNYLEFINEYCLMLLGYTMLNFTQVIAVMDPDRLMPLETNMTVNRWVEMAAVGLIIFMAFVNSAVMVKNSIAKVILSCKKKKHKKQMTELN